MAGGKWRGGLVWQDEWVGYFKLKDWFPRIWPKIKIKGCGKLDVKRGFLVKSFYNFIHKRESRNSMTASFKQIWKTKVPLRMTFFAWEAAKECILTLDILKRKGNTVVNRCYLCKANEESCNHLLLGCPMTYSIWSTVFGLMGLN